MKLVDKLKESDVALSFTPEQEEFLIELDGFYLLRYPRRKEGPIEVGSDQARKLEDLLNKLWATFPEEIIDLYNKLDFTRKGGRILMRKRAEPL